MLEKNRTLLEQQQQLVLRNKELVSRQRSRSPMYPYGGDENKAVVPVYNFHTAAGQS